jgi:hypothetical protein
MKVELVLLVLQINAEAAHIRQADCKLFKLIQVRYM